MLELLLGDLYYILVCIDDILIIQTFGETEAEHLQRIETVLQRLQDQGFMVNLRKSLFMQKEVDEVSSAEDKLHFHLLDNGGGLRV